LRPELLHLFSTTGIDAEDICTLDDISAIDVDKTHLFLVDHNRPRGTIATFYDFDRHPERKALVEGIIDHHVDEGYFKSQFEETPPKRYDIRTTGSCASLVTQYMMGLPSEQSFSPNAKGGLDLLNENIPETKSVARLLMSAILIDTSNFTNKVSPPDGVASHFLAQYLPELVLENYYHAMKSAKDSIGGMSLHDLLRRDYKEFDTKIGKLGMSTITRPISFLQSQFENFEKTVKQYREERSLEVFVVLTVSGEGAEFRRGGMMVTDKYASVIEAFKVQGGERYGIKRDKEGGRGMYNCFAFEMGDLSASRKQIAPLVMEIMDSIERED
jgi:exopolyphosphatase